MEPRKPNKRENDLMIYLMVLRHQLVENGPAVRERLRGKKYAWRDLRLVLRLVDKLQVQLLETMPPTRARYYYQLAQHAVIRVDNTGPVRQDRYMLVSDDKLGLLVQYAIQGECAMCMKEGDDCRRCALRDALSEIAPPRDVDETGWFDCTYHRAAEQMATSDKITF